MIFPRMCTLGAVLELRTGPPGKVLSIFRGSWRFAILMQGSLSDGRFIPEVGLRLRGLLPSAAPISASRARHGVVGNLPHMSLG